MLRRVLGSDSKLHYLSIGKFLERVAVGKRKSAFGPWPYCLAVYNRVMAYIKKLNSQVKAKDRIIRHCHLGKQLVESGGLFWGFFPPGSNKLTAVFKQFLETGIYEYWMEDFYGTGFANRVQDRSRVKSPTKILEDSIQGAYSAGNLKEGHLSTVFVLWSLGLVLCMVVFISEGGISLAIITNRSRKVYDSFLR